MTNTGNGWVSETCATHYGHTLELEDLGKTWLSDDVKSGFAAQLKMGVTKEFLMDKIRNEALENFNRRHLVTRIDMNNIKRSFNLEEIKRHVEDVKSVLAWIEEWATSDDNPVLYYKMQVHDFFISIITVSTVSTTLSLILLSYAPFHFIIKMKDFSSRLKILINLGGVLEKVGKKLVD